MKIIYLLGNIALLVMALYKCQSMGLLPTSPSDWIEFVEHKEVKFWIQNFDCVLFALQNAFEF